MYYHARLFYEYREHYWWNLSKEEITLELLLPFINGQIIPIDEGAKTSLLNMRNVSKLRIYKTEEKIESDHGHGHAPSALLDEQFEKHECTNELIDEVRKLQAAPQSKSLIQKALSTPKKQVFVIMKFGDKFLDSAYFGVIKPTIEKYGFKSLRIDEVQDSGRITDQVLEGIATSQYVFADLTGERPNCYYEVGFAHAIGKEMILTIKKGNKIHFDLADYRFIEWETELELREALRKRLSTIKQSGIGQPNPASS